MCNTLNNNDYIFKVKTNMEIITRPIWQDTYVEFNTNDSPVDYSINLNGEAIFYGKAWAAPAYSEDTFKTNINKICEDYMSNEIDFDALIKSAGTYVDHENAMMDFIVKNETTNKEIAVFKFIYDWSHDKNKTYTDGKVTDMSDPINRKGISGMYYFHTQFNGRGVQTLVSLLPVNGYTETTECNAGKWALYYLNRYGGWDSYLIDGYVSRKDNFVRKNVVKSFNNNTLEFGNKPYMTQITPNYEIHTGWMNDRESEVLAANVFQSTRVYLHNLETDEVIPIVITDADVLHKNHKNSGRRLLNYTINAVSAQTEYNKN